MIIKRIVVGGWRANCYIVGSESAGQGLIIDPGDGERSILAAVRETGLDIKLLVATHGHIDHIGSIGILKKALGAPVAIHQSDSSACRVMVVSSGDSISARPYMRTGCLKTVNYY